MNTRNTLTETDNIRLLIVKNMVKSITGKEFKLFSAADFQANTNDITSNLPTTKAENGNNPSSTGFSLAYDYYEKTTETEQTLFSAQGYIQSTDGKRIDIAIEMQMSCQFLEEKHLQIRAGEVEKIDPLVINFNGNTAELTDTKYRFDLDADGMEEQISFVSPESGFLSLDKNQDGKINDGSELFGPQSNNGFVELARYDQDGNQFIDENDAIYDKLRIWTKDEQGNDQLFALGDKNIGAIYLGNIDTSFALKDTNNQTLG